MEPIVLKQNEISYWKLLIWIPGCGLIMSFVVALALRAEVLRGEFPIEIPGFFCAGVFFAFLSILYFMWTTKDLFYDASREVLYFTRPYRATDPKSKTVVGRPVKVEVRSALSGGDHPTRHYFLQIEGEFENEKTNCRVRVSTLDEGCAIANHIQQLTGVYFKVRSTS